MDTNRRKKFYLVTIGVFAAMLLFVAAVFIYTDYSYVGVKITGSSDAYFVLSYDSTNTTIPFSQNFTVDVLPHADVTVAAFPNSTVTLSSWKVAGAQVLSTGNDTVTFLTGQGGSTIRVTAVLVARTNSA
jgi:hypothetical protein